MLDGVRARLHGEVTVTAPDPRTVSIDGAQASSTPLKTRLNVGRHHVQARDASGHVEEREVIVRPQQAVKLELEAVAVVTEPVAEPPRSPVRLVVELRGTMDPRDLVAKPGQPRVGPAPELSVGAGGKYWLATLGVLAGASVGGTVRATGRLPLVGPLAAELSLQGSLFFTNPVAGGGAALLGLCVTPLGWLDVLVEGGGGFVMGNPGLRPDYVLLSAAVRLKLFG
jgi:hypothetical protein